MILCCRGHNVDIHQSSDIDEEGILLYLAKDNQVWAVGRDGVVDPLSYVVHQSASCAETDIWGLVSLVLVPVGHYCAAFTLENTPVEVLEYLVVALHIFGAGQNFTAAGNMRDGLVVFAT
eukprot:9735036-Ditylum_brightwellii.AAC.1